MPAFRNMTGQQCQPEWTYAVLGTQECRLFTMSRWLSLAIAIWCGQVLAICRFGSQQFGSGSQSSPIFNLVPICRSAISTSPSTGWSSQFAIWVSPSCQSGILTLGGAPRLFFGQAPVAEVYLFAAAAGQMGMKLFLPLVLCVLLSTSGRFKGAWGPGSASGGAA